MRLKIYADSKEKCFIPFKYQCRLYDAISKILSDAATEYARFLPEASYLDATGKLILYNFSKLFPCPRIVTRSGFENVERLTFFVSSPIPEEFEHIFIGIFNNKVLDMNFPGNTYHFKINKIEIVPEPEIKSSMNFICLSPITLTRSSSHRYYLDYTQQADQKFFIYSIWQNLIQKYKIIHGKEYQGDPNFHFVFDQNYIERRGGNIKKIIRFDDSNSCASHLVIAMEAPFQIKTSPELIKIGYECGFGESNHAGFGMAEIVKL